MNLFCIKIFTLLVALSPYSSYIYKKCVDSSSPHSSTDPNSPANRLNIIRSQLLENGALVPQVNHFGVYDNGDKRCAVFFMNLVSIEAQVHLMTKEIEESFTSLIDALIKIKELKDFSFSLASFMFEPNTKKIVFFDIYKILDSPQFAGFDEQYKKLMMNRLKKLLDQLKKDVLKDPPSQSGTARMYPELNVIEKKGKDSTELTFVNDDFEELYSQAYPSHRNRLLKIVDKLPDITKGKTSPLKIKGAKENNILTISASIDKILSKQIEIAFEILIVNLYLCNFYKNKYKKCQLIGDHEINTKGNLEYKIKEGYQIEVVVDRQEVLSYSPDEFITEEASDTPIYAYEIFLVLVPAPKISIPSSKFVIDHRAPNFKTKKVFFYIDEKNKLIARDLDSNGKISSQKKVFEVSRTISPPEGFEFVQTLPELYLEPSEFSSNFKTNLYYIEVPDDYFQASLEENKVHLFYQTLTTNQGAPPVCKKSNPNLQVRVKGRSNIVRFGKKEMTYPRSVELYKTKTNHVCLGGNLKDGFFYTMEEDSKMKFVWSFNSSPYSSNFNQGREILYLINGNFNEIKNVPLKTFDYPNEGTDMILVSIRFIENGYRVKVYSLESSSELYLIYSEKDTKTLYDFLQTLKKVTDSEKKQKLISEKINDFYLEFKDIPKKIAISRNKKTELDLSLEDEVVTYLSGEEVVYSIYKSPPEGCDLYISKEIVTGSKIDGDTIALDCIDRETPGSDAAQQFRPEALDKLDSPGIGEGIKTVVTQARTPKKSKKNRLIL